MGENELTLTTPALLFSALSLLMLAFTNRFLALAQLVRNVHAEYKTNPDKILHSQIRNLRKRLRLIRDLQVAGIGSLLLCVVCMFLVYVGYKAAATMVFGVALMLLIISLIMTIWEILISIHALNYRLSDVEEFQEESRFQEPRAKTSGR
ncbi:MAG: DUF2721 domain-containing protein [Prevotellaceae bacterium]|jgi:hypothetical protein|nr:DUF2721 domain-containing protein [Prevotellaceae bacterium]